MSIHEAKITVEHTVIIVQEQIQSKLGAGGVVVSGTHG